MKNNDDIYPYKYEFAHDNVYGHALKLINQFHLNPEGVHLDLGCGWGAIGSKIIENQPVHYIGIDASQEAITNITSSGKEGYVFQLAKCEENIDFIKKILNGRKISSISIIDVLEHVLYLEEIICTLGKLSQEYNAPVIISVPNFTHDDIVMKLFCYQFDETETGLLDKTHLNIFTERKLLSIFGKYGLHQVRQNDVRMEKSDQYFPKDLLTLAEKSSLHEYFLRLRGAMSSNGKVNQFVRSFIAGPAMSEENEIERPFLSIITRTTGERPQELQEVLLCLTGQECTDFEVLVMGHNLSVDKQLVVESIINDTPEWIRNKIRLVRVNGGNRSTPLNEGFQQANGEYISILDDDDLVFSNWVDEFNKLARKNYGKILRTVTVRQNYEEVKTKFGDKTSRAISGFNKDYPDEYDFLTMLHHNQCPGLCLAFPRSAFHDFGLRFDETINTIEDWDFIVRSSFICGVASAPVVTNIYRWWVKGASSQTLHNPSEWEDNYRYVQGKFNSQPILLPPGSAKRISWLIDHAANNSSSQVFIEDRLLPKRQLAHSLLVSNSWAVTKPIRLVKKLLGKKTCIPDIFVATEEQLDELITNVQSSKSWRITRVFRKN